MSANTRRRKLAKGQKIAKSQKKAQKTDMLAQFAALFGTATTLIIADKRSDAMVQTLINALQLFKENRLGVAMRFLDREMKRSHKELQRILSGRWADTSLPIPTKRYLSELGVRYVGEVFQISWARAHFHREAIEAYLFELGIPMDLDPVAAGWKPEYWDNPRVLKQLAWSIDRLFKRPTYHWRTCHGKGNHYVSQYMDVPSSQIGNLKKIQKALQYKTVLHAAMILPPDFICPEGVPQFWLDYERKEKVHREKMLRERRANALRKCREQPDKMWEHMRANLSVRAANTLVGAGIGSLRELVALKEEEMHSWRYFGQIPMREINRELDCLGLRLGMSAEEIEQVFGSLES